jgi:hypothetical protein
VFKKTIGVLTFTPYPALLSVANEEEEDKLFQRHKPLAVMILHKMHTVQHNMNTKVCP